MKQNQKFIFLPRKNVDDILDEILKVCAVQKYVNLVDLVKSFPTNIYLQKSASIQPRTSISKFGGEFNSLFIRLLSNDLVRFRTLFVEVRTQSHESHFVSRSALSRSFRRRDCAYISLSTQNKILKNRVETGAPISSSFFAGRIFHVLRSSPAIERGEPRRA